jgi:hypothetical protein
MIDVFLLFVNVFVLTKRKTKEKTRILTKETHEFK